MTIKGKTAIITGAGKGIGRAITIALAKEGVNVGLISKTLADLQSGFQNHYQTLWNESKRCLCCNSLSVQNSRNVGCPPIRVA
jgi:NAD(P)-dependent dehydrogenase (short-subunit alcohol dehydrogenase family)